MFSKRSLFNPNSLSQSLSYSLSCPRPCKLDDRAGDDPVADEDDTGAESTLLFKFTMPLPDCDHSLHHATWLLQGGINGKAACRMLCQPQRWQIHACKCDGQWSSFSFLVILCFCDTSTMIVPTLLCMCMCMCMCIMCLVCPLQIWGPTSTA